MKKLCFFAVFLLILSFFVPILKFDASADGGTSSQTAQFSYQVEGVSKTDIKHIYSHGTSDVGSLVNVTSTVYVRELKSLTFIVKLPRSFANKKVQYLWEDTNLDEELEVAMLDGDTIEINYGNEVMAWGSDGNSPEFNLTIAANDEDFTWRLDDDNWRDDYIDIKFAWFTFNIEVAETNISLEPEETFTYADGDNFNITASLIYLENITKIDWYLIVPNQALYLSIKNTNQNINTLTFKPKDYVNETNGYGDYEMFVVITCGENEYISKPINIRCLPAATNPNPEEGEDPTVITHKIVSKEIKNTKASIQAFEYTITNTYSLDPSLICWKVDNTFVCFGFKLIYEPTETGTYSVSVIDLSEPGGVELTEKYYETAKTTATNRFILYIVLGTGSLIGIFTASVIHTNRKRDVVW